MFGVKKVYACGGLWNIRYVTDKTQMLIYQSKATIDLKTLSDNNINLIDPEISAMMNKVCIGTKIPRSIMVKDSMTSMLWTRIVCRTLIFL